MKPFGRILVILNPAARGTRAALLADRIRALSVMATVRLTEGPGDAEAIAERAAGSGWRAIVAAGGDGTVNEVVRGMGHSGIPFGILPVGTMNVFATELGIPRNNLSAAWEIIKQGRVHEVDLPTANGEYFVQLAGVGLDAQVVQETHPDSKKTLGPLSYLLTLAHVAARKPPRIIVRPESGHTREGSFVLVGNGRFYGGPFVLFKGAQLDDGLLDVLVFQNQTHWDIVRYLQAIAFGAHPELHDVEYFQTPSLRLESSEHVPVEVDGELAGALPYDFGISPHPLRVLA